MVAPLSSFRDVLTVASDPQPTDRGNRWLRLGRPCADGAVDEFSELAAFHRLGPDGVLPVVDELAYRYGPAELVWRNELGGLTFRLGSGP